MNREEAIKFYTNRLHRATSENGKIAYATILSGLNSSDIDYTVVKAIISGNSHSACVPSSYRRSIYRRALRELDV